MVSWLFLKIWLFVVFFVLFFSSCEDEIDKSNIYTFVGQSAMDYINSNPDLSLYAKVLQRSHNSHKTNSSAVSALLGTRGNYGVFAPNNEAICIYLDSVYGSHNINLDTISQEEADKIVLFSVIDYRDDAARMVMQLDEGAQVNGTLNDSHIIVRFGDFGDGTIVRINGKSRIVKSNIKVENGYVHVVDRVIPPGPNSVAGLIYSAENMKIFSRLLEMTGWGDSIVKYEDEVYRDSLFYVITNNKEDWNTNSYARNRFYGYTAFVETDDVFQRDWGIPALDIDPETGAVSNMAEVMAEVLRKCCEQYPEAKNSDPHSMDNAVNRFVSYHIIPYKTRFYLLGYNGECYGAGDKSERLRPTDGFDYFPTMGSPSRLLKITKSVKQGAVFLNRHCYYDNSYYGNMQETSCDVEGIMFHENNGTYGETYAPNGYCFPIDNVLVYDDKVRFVVLNERIRYSFPLTIPELANFGAKRKPLHQGQTYGELMEYDLNKKSRIVPPGFCSTLSTTDNFVYDDFNDGFYFHLSSICFCAESNKYRQKEIILKLLPVPYSGEWEVRAAHTRGVMFHSYLGETPIEKDMQDLGIHDYLTDNDYALPIEFQKYNEMLNFFFRNNYTCYMLDSTEMMMNNHIARQHGHMYLPYNIGLCKDTSSGDYFWDCLRGRVAKLPSVRRYHKRNILYRGYMEAGKTYYLKLKILLQGTFRITDYSVGGWNWDFIELVPKSVYANPNREEDFW